MWLQFKSPQRTKLAVYTVLAKANTTLYTVAVAKQLYISTRGTAPLGGHRTKERTRVVLCLAQGPNPLQCGQYIPYVTGVAVDRGACLRISQQNPQRGNILLLET